MSKKEKLISRFKTQPNDFSWDELTLLLTYFGFAEVSKGKTAGSRRAFVNERTRQIIRLHKPHPEKVLKQYQIKEIKEVLGL
ncbi:MAG: type toxin-antitoxin system HicA family toxin [Sphingobacteriaceae bacterium]|jgi:hypothetical protein|nr:type toxin-antitoxin system HicA family toxin [Sphingobacteriaceae bacterium]